MAIMSAILELLFGGFTQTATAMGNGLSAFAEAIFIKTVGETTGLTTLGQLTVIFAGIALALSLCKFLLVWVTSFGNAR